MSKPKIRFNAATGKVDVIVGDAFDKARVHDLPAQPLITKNEDVASTVAKWLRDDTSDVLIIRTPSSLQ